MKIDVFIKPNTRHRDEVVPAEDGTLVVYTTAPAVEGRANLAATKLLAAHFGVPKSRVTLIRGAASRRKVFEITA